MESKRKTNGSPRQKSSGVLGIRRGSGYVIYDPQLVKVRKMLRRFVPVDIPA
jgi:hypothetical protein